MKNIEIDTVEDEFIGIFWLCNECIKKYKNLITEDEFYDGIGATCSQCFKEWKEM